MSGAQLATTTFSGGPNEALAAVDAYGQKTASVVNSIQNLAKSFNADVMAALESQGIKQAKDLISKVNEVAKLNPEALVQRLLGNNELQSAYRQLTSDIKNGLNIDDKLVDSIEATVNGITTQIKTVDFSSVKSLGVMVNNLTSGQYAVELLDKGAVSGMLTSIAAEANKLGLKGTFTAISEGITDVNILMNSVNSLLPLAVKPEGFSLFLDLCDSKVKGEIIKTYPNVISEVVKNYRQQPQTNEAGMVSLFDTTTATFDSVDAAWKYQTRDTVQVLTIYDLANSSEFQRLLEAKVFSQHKEIPSLVAEPLAPLPVHNEDEKFLLLAKVMSTTTCKAELMRQFPVFNLTVDESLSDYKVSEPSFTAP